MTSATARNTSSAAEHRIARFQTLKVLFLVENNSKGHLLLCHPFILHKAGSASRLLWKSFVVPFHDLAIILHFPYHAQVLLVRIT